MFSFIQKPIGAVTILGTAVGAPYALFETEAGKAARVAALGLMDSSSQTSSSTVPSGGAVPAGVAPIPHTMLIPQSATAPNQTVTHAAMTNGPTLGTPVIGSPVVGAPVGTFLPNQAALAPTAAPWVVSPTIDLREAIRFDMTPMALTQRFAPVTTLAGYSQFDVYRIGLVTGSQPTDLAGTVTYYFDANKAVQRIQFFGNTGDPSMVIGMMVQFYRLQPEAALGGQLFTTRWNNRVTSFLHVRPAAVVQAGYSNSNYQVFLELNQPSMHYGLSDDANQYLATLAVTR
jgi:hypothetical protein